MPRLFTQGNRYGVTHGLSKTRAYASWRSMKRRCLSPDYAQRAYYGGRGITICTRWLDFVNFYADMGERPEGTSLDRIDNDGDYEPANCRWATPTEQMKNRRCSCGCHHCCGSQAAAQAAPEQA